MELVGLVRWRGRLVSRVVVDIDGNTQVILGRGVSGVGQDHANIAGGVGALCPIHHVALIVREAMMAGLTECLFQEEGGYGW